jgi:hypothetical protein
VRIVLSKTGADVVSVPSQELLIVNPDLTQTGQVRAIREAGIGENTEVVRGWVLGVRPEHRSPRSPRSHRRRGWIQRNNAIGRLLGAVVAVVAVAGAFLLAPDSLAYGADPFSEPLYHDVHGKGAWTCPAVDQIGHQSSTCTPGDRHPVQVAAERLGSAVRSHLTGN